ncbi:Bug family tripartite tricarboxylate transporter substrate binding protein [Noviherbaspirillum massiliense]|uniref:Bug family tripartite tricarboxylate transporter substrate binding protein n=1 Tax=Noviherbaspirillum massiliense TaxID=1465823 RepID=UPI0002EA60B2|nr:tripartite tricarboxylate transporter substrate binding protein [Noviherbaspirillum massiliense]
MRNKSLKRPLQLAVSVLALSIANIAAAWEPSKPVEFVVPFSAGGATDQMARSIQGIIAKHKLMNQPVIVTNKAGASGAEGLLDIKAAKGDPHRVVVSSTGLFTVPLATGLPFNWRDLTPVAMVAQDEFMLWVNSETPYKTSSDFIAAVKKAPPGQFKMGGTSSKREDHVITAMVEKKAGVKFTYIPYKGGGEVTTQLSGKHIDADTNNPSESIGQWRAGEQRPLCLFANERSAYKEKVTQTMSWGDVPTCKEQGLDVEYQMMRIFLLPGGVPSEATKYYEDLFQKVVATPEWKEYMQKNALKDNFKTGNALRDYLTKDEQEHRAIMKEAGFLAPNAK